MMSVSPVSLSNRQTIPVDELVPDGALVMNAMNWPLSLMRRLHAGITPSPADDGSAESAFVVTRVVVAPTKSRTYTPPARVTPGTRLVAVL